MTQQLSRRTFLELSAGASLSQMAQTTKAQSSRPNIILLLGDAHRWDALGSRPAGGLARSHHRHQPAYGRHLSDPSDLKVQVRCSASSHSMIHAASLHERRVPSPGTRLNNGSTQM